MNKNVVGLYRLMGSLGHEQKCGGLIPVNGIPTLTLFIIGVSEWLLVNANSAIFQLYHGENKLIFNEMMMRSALYKTNALSWICIVLVH
jgi:hypothetical protein